MSQLPNTRQITVAADAGGERLDRYLAETLADLTRSRLKALIEDGRVRLAGAVVTEANRRVKPGDAIELDVPAPVPLDLVPESVPLDILYEDDDLLVVHKPAGMVVHPSPGHAKGTLVHALLAHCGASLSGIGGVQRPGIVHRIDKDVSGLLLIAKSDKAHLGLAGQFTVHSVDRQYDAIVYGCPRPSKGSIDKPIARHPKDRKRQAIVSSGKRALTDYSTILTADTIAHLRCKLHTGRTHQIRVHLASIGHCLLGDPVYKPRRKPRLGRALVAAVTDLDRICLHAAVIGFVHPISGTELHFEAPMPALFCDLLDAGKD